MTELEFFLTAPISECTLIFIEYLWALYTHGDSRHDSAPHIIKDADEVGNG